ncbi:MAG TPA: PsiF family protein [Hyphomicrobiaceae bacterium]|nr:PsiF family protein [Hyphomicrobiaceae bacterium]
MKATFTVLAGAAALVVSSGVAFGQAMPQTGTMSGAKAPSSRSSASLECSRQADAKGLHGKPRKHFRSRCLRGMAGKIKADGTRSYR